jgi:hypothetical protein
MPLPPDGDTDSEEGNSRTDKKDEHVSETEREGERGSPVLLFGSVYS